MSLIQLMFDKEFWILATILLCFVLVQLNPIHFIVVEILSLKKALRYINVIMLQKA